jgi:Cd2+/Zn2+-exporting ATPase
MKKLKLINFDYFLLASLTIIIIGHYSRIIPRNFDEFFITFFSCIATLPVLISTYKSIRNKKISVDLLASIALLVSLLNKEWASAVFINLMLTSARIFASYTETRSQNAIQSLLKLRPDKVKIKNGKNIIEIEISKIKQGDLIVIELGDRIPVDGIVVSGSAEIDQSSLTGESIPISKGKGDKVFSSTLNASGSLIIKAEKVGKDTTFEKLIKLVADSQDNKIGIKTFADKFTSWYIMLTVVGAVALYFFSSDLRLVLAVLLVTCADDIAVAIPMAFSAAIGSAARNGIIVKGGEFFEGLNKVKTILIDKTGTITKGKLKIGGVYSLGVFDKLEILKMAAIADCFSEHPVAKAISDYANEQKVEFEKPEKFEEISGMGSTAEYKNKTIFCGREKFFDQAGMKIPDEQKKALEKIKKEGDSLLLVSYDNILVGYIKYSDEIKEDAKEAIFRLKELGVENIVMLTGDNEVVAQKIAKKAGIDSFHANLLPEDKIKFVKEYVGKKNGKVAMIGDGVNDAASLALSDVGIAMGVIGTDTAIEAADIALMKDNLLKVPEAFELSKLVIKISRQDFLIWGVLNTTGLVLAFTRVIGPESAAAFNFITDFVPILNSLRLFGYKISKN